MSLKDKIESALRDARPSQEMESLLTYMNVNGFYTCRSSSHNHWTGGTAEHVWACYLIAKRKRWDILAQKPHLLQYATDEKLAVVCLLHDLCDMNVVGPGIEPGHGWKSCSIMRKHRVGTPAEQEAVKNHMHGRSASLLRDREGRQEYEALHDIICGVDYQASGTAWHSERFKRGVTQHQGVSSGPGHLRAVALDRTSQCLDYHIYLDYTYDLQEIRGYNRDRIVWNDVPDKIAALKREDATVPGETDIITELHSRAATHSTCCLALGIDPEIPASATTRLRNDWRNEQDWLICSNVLNSLYRRTDPENGHHYEYTMRDEIRTRYRQQDSGKGIFLPGVTFFREGPSEGFRMVAPWVCDVLLVPGWKGVKILD